jgi:hypothetical protein
MSEHLLSSTLDDFGGNSSPHQHSSEFDTAVIAEPKAMHFALQDPWELNFMVLSKVIPSLDE